MSNLNKSIDALIASRTEPILKTLTSMERKVEQNLQRLKKTMRDLCNVSTMNLDDEVGDIEVYWRTELDVCETKIIIDLIEAKDENGIVYEVKLDEHDMESVVQELYLEKARA